MEYRTRKIMIITGVSILSLIFLWNVGLIRSYKSQPMNVTPPKTAEQIEKEDLVAKINSGSVLWQRYQKQEEDYALLERVAAEAKEKQERITAGYRIVLCQKYNLLLSSNGGLETAATCAESTETQSDFQ